MLCQLRSIALKLVGCASTVGECEVAVRALQAALDCFRASGIGALIAALAGTGLGPSTRAGTGLWSLLRLKPGNREQQNRCEHQSLGHGILLLREFANTGVTNAP